MEPLKLGILGLDSTHFDAFYEIFTEKQFEIEVFFLHENSSKVIERRLTEFPELKDCIDSSRAELCDCFMVLNRFGDAHLASLEKVISFKKPIFIDKPISDSLETTYNISRLAKKYNTPITSHSPLEFSQELSNLKDYLNIVIDLENTLILSGPLECNDLGDDPRLKSPLFYGIHLTEIISSIIGKRNYTISSKVNVERSSIYIKMDNHNFIIDLYPNGAEFYNMSNYNNKDGYVNFNIVLDGSYYERFYEFLVNFFHNKTQTNYGYKSVNAMKIINEVL